MERNTLVLHTMKMTREYGKSMMFTEPDIKTASLAERVGVKTETAKNFIQWMKKKGVLKMDDQGCWMIVE